MSDNCPHHKYVVEHDRKTDERLTALETANASNVTLIKGLCERIDKLANAIESMVDANAEKMLNYAAEVATLKARTDSNEKDIGMVRGIVLGAFGTALTLCLGWVIWWLQNRAGR